MIKNDKEVEFALNQTLKNSNYDRDKSSQNFGRI